VKSVADELRKRSQHDIERLPPAERLELALRLGDDDVELFCRARGIERALAVRQLRAQRRRGRTPSKAAEL
jgi:hypothetical protein